MTSHLLYILIQSFLYIVRVSFITEYKIVDQLDLKSRFQEELNQLNTDIIANSEADIDFIFDKSLYQEKPFKISGKNKEVGGFRDVLIWNLWLNYLERHHKIYREIIIVNADKDFVSDGFILQDALIEDLKLKGISTDKVKVIQNVKEFTELVISRIDDENYHKVLKDSELFSYQSKIINDVLANNLIEEDIKLILENYFPIEYEPTIDYLENNNNINILSCFGTKADLYLYFLEDFNLSIEYFIPKHDYFGSNNTNIEIIDYNWNKWVMRVVEHFTIQVGFECNLDITNEEILDVHYYVDDYLVPLNSSSLDN